MTNRMTFISRKLRNNPTDVEKILWSRLKARQVHGVKFRRQVPVGPYVVDFMSFDIRLIIELDGGQHADAANYDEERTRFLKARGFFVMRFWNNEVVENIDGVMERVAVYVQAPPP